MVILGFVEMQKQGKKVNGLENQAEASYYRPFRTECAEELRGRSKEKVLEQANKESKPGSIRTGRKGQMRKHRERRSLIFGYE